LRPFFGEAVSNALKNFFGVGTKIACTGCYEGSKVTSMLHAEALVLLIFAAFELGKCGGKRGMVV
jgi:hypothetical protein